MLWAIALSAGIVCSQTAPPPTQTQMRGSTATLADTSNSDSPDSTQSEEQLVAQAQKLLVHGSKTRSYDSLFAALKICETALALDPSSREALDLRIRIAHRLGSVGLARELREAQEVASATEAESMTFSKMDGDYAANLLRWGQIDVDSRPRHLERTDQALTLLSGANTLRSRFDRIHALLARSKNREALEEFDRLSADQAVETFPPYVLFDIAEAHARLGDPATAIAFLQIGLAKVPTNHEARVSLVYAYCDDGQFTSASSLVDAMYAEQKAWIWRDGGRQPRADYRKLDLAVIAAHVRRFSGDHHGAQIRLEELRTRSPGNSHIRRNLADVYLDRGWHRLARQEHSIGSTLGGDRAMPAAGAAWASLRLRDFPAAERQIEEFSLRAPQGRELMNLQRAWQRHLAPELRVNARVGRSDGSTFGSRSHNIESTLFSAPVFDQYRFFIRSWLAFARFPEGDENQSRVGVGFDYRAPSLELLGEIHESTSSDRGLGLTLGGRWYLDDKWSTPFSIERRSKETPLRARKHGTQADAVSLGLSWREHEERSADASFRIMDFDDGNLRVESMLGLSQEVYDSGRTTLRAGLGLYYSSNSETDVFYYSPIQDLSAEISLEAKSDLYRSPDLWLAHSLSIGVGEHWQSGFDAGTTAFIEYRQYLNLSESLDLEYGVLWARRIYDGMPERELAGTLALSWRF